MVKYVVSNKTSLIQGYTVVNMVSDIKSDFSVIIYNSSDASTEEDTLDLISLISNDIGARQKYIYLSDVSNGLLRSIFMLLGGIVIDSFTDIPDSDLLDMLVSDYSARDMGVSAVRPDEQFDSLVGVLSGLQQSDTSKVIELLQNDVWLEALRSSCKAVKDVLDAIKFIIQDSIKALDTANKKIESLSSKNVALTADVNALKGTEETVNKRGVKSKDSNTSFIYAPYTITGRTSNILFVKEYPHCHFLVSFLIAYQAYLKNLSYRYKILLVCSNHGLMIDRYRSEDIPCLSEDSLNLVDTTKDVYVTYAPKKTVIDTFMGFESDGCIIVDMLYNGDPIINGSSVIRFNAVGGLGAIKRWNLPLDTCISTAAAYDKGIAIPLIDEYASASNHMQRVALYSECCTESFKKLDAKLGIASE